MKDIEEMQVDAGVGEEAFKPVEKRVLGGVIARAKKVEKREEEEENIQVVSNEVRAGNDVIRSEERSDKIHSCVMT